MRPRHKAAENERVRLDRVSEIGASMRPRHKAAENHGPVVTHTYLDSRFNEAAA